MTLFNILSTIEVPVSFCVEVLVIAGHLLNLFVWLGIFTQSHNRHLKSHTERIVIDHTHSNEAAAAFEIHTLDENIEVLRILVCDTQSWAECLNDLKKIAVATGCVLQSTARVNVSKNSE